MINVVLYTSQWDTGGQGWRIKQAFDYHEPDFSVRSIHTQTSYYHYPADIAYTPEKAYALFDQADVVHMRNGLEGLDRLLGSHQRQHEVPVILHHHGTRFRNAHQSLSAEARLTGAKQLASTIDLTLLEPDVEWLPAPFDLTGLRNYRPLFRATGPVRIAHAPTNRDVKNTSRIIEAVRNLVKTGYHLTFDLIERETHEETLRRKGLADLLVDQLDLGIGNNALEAFGMSIPVIAGVADPVVREAMIARWGSLPFYEADHENFEEKLAHLVRNYELRSYWGANGFDYMLAWHEESKVAARLAAIYRNAMSSSSAGVVPAVEGVA